MEKGDIILNLILTIFLTSSSTFIYEIFELEQTILVLITFVVISLIWLNSYIKEINKLSKDNLSNINQNKKEINSVRKDLNIERRLSGLENWRNNMKKRGAIEIPDLIKIGAVLIFLYLLYLAFTKM